MRALPKVLLILATWAAYMPDEAFLSCRDPLQQPTAGQNISVKRNNYA